MLDVVQRHDQGAGQTRGTGTVSGKWTGPGAAQPILEPAAVASPRAPSRASRPAVPREARYSGVDLVRQARRPRRARAWEQERGSRARRGRQRAQQLARVQLAAADRAGDERQQRDPDDGAAYATRVDDAPPPEPVDVDELVARLRDEVRRSGADPGGPGGGERLAARAEAERVWPVSADRNLRLRPGGGVGTPVKAVLRKLMRWYVEPLAYDQRSYNAALLRLVDDQERRIAALEAELAAARDER